MRHFFSFSLLIALIAGTMAANAQTPYKLKSLPYSTSALEPYIDTQTMEIHYGKHHQAYVDNLNKALEGSDLRRTKLEDLFKQASTLPPAVRNNAGGHWNHTFFWEAMTDSKSRREIPSKVQKKIEQEFGSLEVFKEQFQKAGLAQFGSGWVWLIQTPDKRLAITTTPNQDNPLMDSATLKGTPLLACDIWEHAYYLKYQNKRADYITGFWSVVDWKRVGEKLK